MRITRGITIGWLLVSVLVFLGFGIWGAIQADIYFNGERASAHIDSCETHREYSRRGSYTQTRCRGTWRTADGRTHTAEIEGAEYADRDHAVAVRVDGDLAIVDSRWELWPLGVAAGALVSIVIAAAAVRATRRRTRPTVPSGYRAGPFG